MRRLMPLLAFSTLVAQQPHGSHPEQRQFDFWLGTWEVVDSKGALLGWNQVVPLLNGVVLQENWEGVKGGRGTSLNAYLPSKGLWRQTWVDDHGDTLELEGNYREGRMMLEGMSKGKRQRITWTPLPGDRVQQVWEESGDGGASWGVLFEGLYRRPSVQDTK